MSNFKILDGIMNISASNICSRWDMTILLFGLSLFQIDQVWYFYAFALRNSEYKYIYNFTSIITAVIFYDTCIVCNIYYNKKTFYRLKNKWNI